MLECRDCEEVLPLSEFYKHPGGQEFYRCKSCYTWANALSRYKLTPDQYTEMLIQQRGVCAICKKRCKHYRSLSVDHCHRTGKVRGLLCKNCNTALGNVDDNIDTLKAAIKYLEESNHV